MYHSASTRAMQQSGYLYSGKITEKNNNVIPDITVDINTSTTKPTQSNRKTDIVNMKCKSIDEAEQIVGFLSSIPNVQGLDFECVYINTSEDGAKELTYIYKNEDKLLELTEANMTECKAWSFSPNYEKNGIETMTYTNIDGYTIDVGKLSTTDEKQHLYAFIKFPNYYINIHCEQFELNELKTILDSIKFINYEE